jgi:hypothetical protein
MSRVRVGALAVLVAACGSGNDKAAGPAAGTVVGGPISLAGFEVPPPAPNEFQFISSLVKDIQPGSDVTYCEYLDWQSDADFDITDYHGYQSTTGHHVILFAVPTRQPVDMHVCTETDMINVRFLAAGGNEAGNPEMPTGIVMRLQHGMQLMIQSHWINTVGHVIDGQSALNVKMGPSSPDNIVAGLFTDVTTNIDVPAMGAGTARADCTVGEQMTFFTLGGHMHSNGTEIAISFVPQGGQATEIYRTPWEESFGANPPRNHYTLDAPFVVNPGDSFAVDCTYTNRTSAPITFPGEMCVMWGYHYPATREINCVDGAWPPAPAGG